MVLEVVAIDFGVPVTVVFAVPVALVALALAFALAGVLDDPEISRLGE